MHSTKIDINKDTRETIIGMLNDRLADSLDLKSQAKQGHWNLKGMNFIALHELFDDVATQIEDFSDTIAERVTILGGTAEGNSSRGGRKIKLKSISDGNNRWS